MSDHCINCGHPEADAYDLQLRSDRSTTANLCEECHTALERELSSS